MKNCVLPCIRGFIASASLKPLCLADDGKQFGQYPRLYCLGLIEACSRSIDRGRSVLYPRLYCLGLIEAAHSVSAGVAARELYPRLYCLGLIEASR